MPVCVDWPCVHGNALVGSDRYGIAVTSRGRRLDVCQLTLYIRRTALVRSDPCGRIGTRRTRDGHVVYIRQASRAVNTILWCRRQLGAFLRPTARSCSGGGYRGGGRGDDWETYRMLWGQARAWNICVSFLSVLDQQGGVVCSVRARSFANW